jgi:hypothetical protein
MTQLNYTWVNPSHDKHRVKQPTKALRQLQELVTTSNCQRATVCLQTCKITKEYKSLKERFNSLVYDPTACHGNLNSVRR